MSYDLVFWGGSSGEDPNEIWARLGDGEEVEGIQPLVPGDVARAFERVFGAKVRVSDGVLEGPGFEVGLEEGAPYLQISCAWGLLESDEGRDVLARIEEAGRLLGAQVFNPQLATPPTTSAHARGDLAQLGPGRIVQHASPHDDRARSFANVELFEVRGHGDAGSVQSVFLADAGGIYAARDARHPSQLTDIACEYVRLVQDVLPFDVFVVHGHGTQKHGEKSNFGSSLLSVVDGAFGFIGSRYNTHAERENGAIATEWTSFQFSTTGPGSSRDGRTTDLTPLVVKAARDALARAQRGDTRRLRDWMVLFASFDTDGRGTEELLRADTPATGPYARELEVFDSGAVMPIWAQFPGSSGAFHVEARLRLPERDGFALKLVRTNMNAAVRHELPSPLGNA